MRELRVVRADPAGNITLFVLTPVEKAECAAVAAKLLAIEALKAEQVGFIFPNGHMEMEAGEFCGNASRAYGYLLAKQQGLKVLARGINRSENNSTRFLIVTNQPIFCKDAKKVSICFEVAHESGSLYHMLSHFIYNDLNMVKIESRPIEGRNWEYRFFVDFEGNLTDSGVKNALRGMRDEARALRILGNY